MRDSYYCRGRALLLCGYWRRCCYLLLALLLTGSGSALAMQPASHESGEADKVVLGWLQSIRLLPDKRRLTAKLDTGAKSSAIHAENIVAFTKKGQRYVRFSVPVERKGKIVHLQFELPEIKQTKIKQHDRELDIRHVVKLDFCIDSRLYTAQFSLDDREKFNYPVLLGRSFLMQHFVVDPDRTFVKKYQCPM